MKHRITWMVAAAIIAVAIPVEAQMAITLNDAMEIAGDNSPDIKRTKLDLERSSQMLAAQKAQLKSQFSLRLNPFNYSSDRTFNDFLSAWSTRTTTGSSGTFTISQPIEATDGVLSLNNRLSWQDTESGYAGTGDTSFNNDLYLSLSQPIFTYNRTRLDLRELELDLQSTRLNYALQKLTLEQRIAISFYSAYQTMMALDIAREELTNQEEGYRIIANKVDAGLDAPEELYQAELNLATSQLNVQNSEVQLANSLDNFKIIVGIPIENEIAVNADFEHESVAVNLTMAVTEGLANRLELRQHEVQLENAMANLTRTSALNEFRGNVELSYGITGNDEQIGEIYDHSANRQSVGFSLEIPLWDWGERESRIRAANASINRQRLIMDDEKNTIKLGIRQTYRTLNNLERQIEIAQTSVRNAELTYDINLERYRNGDLTSYDINQFQTQLSQRKMALIQARIEYKLALLDLKVQTLWDFEHDRSALTQDLYE